MRKYSIILSLFAIIGISNSCSENELHMTHDYSDMVEDINTEDKLQQFLNNAYIGASSTGAFGTQVILFGDILGDNLFVSNSNSQFLTSYNLNYNGYQNDFGMYGSLYGVINSCNTVIANTGVPSNSNVVRIKAEAKILRALSYFTLVNFYSPTPTSGINQEYGVPLVLGDYDSSAQPARASVGDVYNQIIADLQSGIDGAIAEPGSKTLMSKTVAKLILTKVYLTRRAPGDAQLALQLSTDIINSSPGMYAPIDPTENGGLRYQNYFAATDSKVSEEQTETIWELDLNSDTNRLNGIGSNVSLPCYYSRLDSRKCLLFTQTFYNSLTATDVRKGSTSTGLLINTGVPGTDNPKGFWTNKFPRLTDEGNYFRNIKVFRFADVILSRIEALYLTGQNAQALSELNTFAASRKSAVYTGANLLEEILKERQLEFYGEGHRFFDLKRYGLANVKSSNCVMNCNVPGNDKLFVLPVSQSSINKNPNLTQYPGY